MWKGLVNDGDLDLSTPVVTNFCLLTGVTGEDRKESGSLCCRCTSESGTWSGNHTLGPGRVFRVPLRRLVHEIGGRGGSVYDVG